MSLRARLLAPAPLVVPGAYDALTARLIAAAGFEAVYLSGAGVSYSHLARPDIGLVTLGEVVERLRGVADAAAPLPVIADGDDGHGNALGVMRTVRLFEAAGAAAIQLEDQASPKRCGHLDGKRLVDPAVMVGKLRAARDARRSPDFLIVARTDARAVLGLDAAIARARLYRDAGADLLFVEAPRDEDELRAVAAALPDVPLVANIVEGGRTPPLSADELAALGYRLVLFPNSLLRRFVRAGADLLAELRRAGTTRHLSADMCSFDRLGDLLGLPALAAAESSYLPEEP